MSENSVYDRVVKILVDNFGVDASAVGPDATFENLDLDSLDLVEFALAAEEELGVRIEDEEAEGLETLGACVKLLEEKGAKVSEG